MPGPSRHTLALAATLLVLFAVNAVAGSNMCMDPAQMTSDDGTCTQVNKEIEDKLLIDPSGFGDKFARVTCEDPCGREGAAALQLMHANPSCCGGSKDRLLCHSSDGKCDPAAINNPGGGGNTGVVIAIVISVLFVALVTCMVCVNAESPHSHPRTRETTSVRCISRCVRARARTHTHTHTQSWDACTSADIGEEILPL